MGPGPSNVAQPVLDALSQPTIGHLDPQFIEMMDRVRALQQYAFQTESDRCFTISAPGSAGMEACLINLLEPGDGILVCINGVFGTRMAEIARRAGAQVHVHETPWGRAIDPDEVARLLETLPDVSLLAFVHAETSTGALSDAKRLAQVANEHDCLSIVDTVTSLGGVPLAVDEWGLDAVYSGSQKCLSCVPGLSPLVFSQRAWERLEQRRHPVQSWFLDLRLLAGYWGGSKRAYHHTAPVNAIYAWHRALEQLHDEGLKSAWSRHATQHHALRAGFQALGLSFVVPDAERLPQLNSVWIPEGVDDAITRTRLLNDFHLEIGAGLGDFAGRVWRIGVMGHNARPDAVLTCLDALGEVLGGDPSAGRGAAEQHYRQLADA